MAKGGPKTPEGKAKALKNLDLIKPGEVRNPAGRPSAGMSVREWWNVMQDWTEARVYATANNKDEPVNKRAAAQRWISAINEADNGKALDQIMDRTEGKPKQTMELDGKLSQSVTVQGAMGQILSDPETLAVAEKLADRLGSGNDVDPTAN